MFNKYLSKQNKDLENTILPYDLEDIVYKQGKLCHQKFIFKWGERQETNYNITLSNK
jgi:hypothetical protein